MSTPGDFDQDTKVEDTNTEQILFRFCSECSNLLFPKEDKESNRLNFTCRTCKHTENAPIACVMRHEIGSSVGATAGITQDVAQDPTLPRVSKECPRCHETEAVCFQSQQRSADTGMKLYYVCVGCGNVWQVPDKMIPKFEKPEKAR